MPVLKNSQHERFAQALAKGMNAHQAYTEAGFKPNYSNGNKLAKRPEVAARVEEILGRAAMRVGVTAEMVIAELAKIGFSDIRNAVKWGAEIKAGKRKTAANHVELVPSDQVDDDTAAAIAEVSQNATGGVRVKFHDKRAALVDIGRYLGMFKDKVEHSGPDGGPIRTEVDISSLTPEQLAAIASIRITGE